MDESMETNNEEINEQEIKQTVRARRRKRRRAVKEQKEQLSEYDIFDSDSDEPILVSDQDKDAWIGTPKVRNKIVDARDVLSKDLRMSFIDKELAFIFGMWLEAVEEWRNHGLNRLSNRRAVHLVGQLSLFASVEGKERIMQGKPSISFDTTMRELQSMRSDTPIQEEESSGKKRSVFRRYI